MARTEAQKRASRKYNATHTDAMRFDAAERAGVSPSTYMRDAIIARMEQDEQAPKE